MSATHDEIDELYKRQELLMDYLGLEFDYDFNEVKGIIEKRKAPEEPEPEHEKTGDKSSRYIDFKEIDAKLEAMHTVDEVNNYEDELLAMDLTYNQKRAIRNKVIDRRRSLIYTEKYKRRY